ncbi:hypothetical protein [Cloacibacillus porcorum]|uniref:hypothetical protein n=1 Tax=Cloacibacillus porcorum TaxID=1197717 RepID=UPI003D0570F3
MSTELKRFTISVTPEMEKELYEAKKSRYYMDTKNEMIRNLIWMGLDQLKKSMCAEER